MSCMSFVYLVGPMKAHDFHFHSGFDEQFHFVCASVA